MTIAFPKRRGRFGCGLLFILLAVGAASAQSAPAASPDPGPFVICKSQTYALCALASCFVMDGVSYCKCDVKSGDSISLKLSYGPGQDVCIANAEGAANGYMMSTFSYPETVSAPYGNEALYDCPATTAPYGASAQCDGGVCFKSTEGQSFPGFPQPLSQGQIICSCPIAVTNPSTAQVGFQIAGPYPCQQAFFKNCVSPTATPLTGASLYVGAPTGSAELLTRILTGQTRAVNHCTARAR